MSDDNELKVQKIKPQAINTPSEKKAKGKDNGDTFDSSLFGNDDIQAFEDIKDTISIHEQSKALQEAVQKGFEGTTSYDLKYGFDTKKAQSQISSFEYTQMLDEIIANNSHLSKKELNKLFKDISGMDIETYLEQKKNGSFSFDITQVSETNEKRAKVNYASQKAKFGETALANQAKKTVKTKKDTLQETEREFQEVLDNEGAVSYLMNGIISIFGTSRGDVKDAIKLEDKNIQELKELADKKDVQGFMAKYQALTGAEFNIKNFVKLSNAEAQYFQAMQANKLQNISEQLKKDENWYNRKYNYNLDSFENVMRSHTPNYSPLEKAIWNLYQDKEMCLEWINTKTEELNLKGLSPKERYNALVKEFTKNADTIVNNTFKEKDFEAFTQEYKSALLKAFGKNIPQEKLNNYVENQATAKGALQTAVMIGVGMLSGGSALAAALAVGTMGAAEKATDKNGLTRNDAISIGGDMALTYGGWKVFGLVAGKTTPKIQSWMLKRGINPNIANPVARLSGAAAGGATSATAETTLVGIINGDDIETIAKNTAIQAAFGAGFAVVFASISEAVNVLKAAKASKAEIKTAEKNLISSLSKDSHAELQALAKEIQEKGLSKELLTKTTRAVAKVHHPDLGGSPEKMAMFNSLISVLEKDVSKLPAKSKTSSTKAQSDSSVKNSDVKTGNLLPELKGNISPTSIIPNPHQVTTPTDTGTQAEKSSGFSKQSPAQERAFKAYQENPLGLDSVTLQTGQRMAELQRQGGYGTSPKVLGSMSLAMQGIKPNSYGVNYYSSSTVSDGILKYLQNGEILPGVVQEIDTTKTKIARHHALFTAKDAPAKSDTTFYLKNLKTSVAEVESTLQSVGLSSSEIEIFRQYVSEVSPMMYNMGFPDCVNHPAQVAKLCAIYAAKDGASLAEILKSAIVGYGHDPKLDSAISWGNLASHPISAAAMSQKILSEGKLYSLLLKYFDGNTNKVDDFIDGITQALSINNDSKFVLDNAILDNPPFPVHDSSTTLGRDIKTLRTEAQRRFSAPAQGQPTLPLSPAAEAQLAKQRFDTGFRFINKEKFTQIAQKLAQKYPEITNPENLYDNILEGKISNPELIKELKAELQSKGAIEKEEIPALALFAHHAELSPSATVAAKSLITADPLMLSLHKIIPTQSTGYIQSYLKSFTNNINNLPKEAQSQGITMKRSLLNHYLQAADELNGRQIGDYSKLSMQELEAKYLDQNTWGKYFETQVQSERDALCSTLEKYYNKVLAEQSVSAKSFVEDDVAKPAISGEAKKEPIQKQDKVSTITKANGEKIEQITDKNGNTTFYKRSWISPDGENMSIITEKKYNTDGNPIFKKVTTYSSDKPILEDITINKYDEQGKHYYEEFIRTEFDGDKIISKDTRIAKYDTVTCIKDTFDNGKLISSQETNYKHGEQEPEVTTKYFDAKGAIKYSETTKIDKNNNTAIIKTFDSKGQLRKFEFEEKYDASKEKDMCDHFGYKITIELREDGTTIFTKYSKYNRNGRVHYAVKKKLQLDNGLDITKLSDLNTLEKIESGVSNHITKELYKYISNGFAEEFTMDIDEGKSTFSQGQYGRTIHQLDDAKRPNATSERIVYSGLTAEGEEILTIVDHELDLLVNKTASRISKSIATGKDSKTGKPIYKTVDISKEITPNEVILTDNTTGEKIVLSLDDMAKRIGIGVSMKEMRTGKVSLEYMAHALPPTTLLSIKALLDKNPDMKIEWTSDADKICFAQPGSGKDVDKLLLNLKEGVVTHEVLHAVDFMTGITTSKEIQNVYFEELKNSSSDIKEIAEYAVIGGSGIPEAGLQELIAMAGTFHDTVSYEQGSGEAEALRLAFPKTIKLIETRLIEWQQELLKEYAGKDSIAVVPQVAAPTSSIKNQLKQSSVATAEDLKAVQKIDKENFAGHYEIEDNLAEYTQHLTGEQITTRVFKNSDGKVIGYYQLEPVQDGELYIYSIGVPKDLRNTRESYKVLKSMQEEIISFAKDNNIKKVALDVDADNQMLVKLYKKFGFEITGENNGVEDGNPYHDYHMEIDVAKALSKDTVKAENPKIADTKALEPEPTKAQDEIPGKLQENPIKIQAKTISKEEFIEKILSYEKTLHYDIYLNECLNPDGKTVNKDILKVIERNFELGIFSEEMTKSLVKAFKENPELVTECQAKGIKYPDNVVQASKINSEITRILLDSGETDGYKIFSLTEKAKDNVEIIKQCMNLGIKNDRYDIDQIVEADKTNPALVQQCFSLGMKDGYDIEAIVEAAQTNSALVQQCFSLGITKASQIEMIVEAGAISPEWTQKCFDLDIIAAYDIKTIVEAAQKSPEFVQKCFDLGIKDSSEIETIAKASMISPEFVQKSFDADIKDGYEIELIAKAGAISPEWTQKCLDMDMKNGSGIMLIAEAGKANSQVTQKCFDLGIKYGGDIKTIVEAVEKSPEFVQKCFDLGIKHSGEIKMIAEAGAMNAELTQKCIDMNIKLGVEIRKIVWAAQYKPEMVQKCFDLGIKNGESIEKIVNASFVNPEFTQKCLDMGIRNGIDILLIAESSQINSELVQKCLDASIQNGSYIRIVVDAAQKDPKLYKKYSDMANKGEITQNALPAFVLAQISIDDYNKLLTKAGVKFVSNLSQEDLYVACTFIELYDINDLNKISVEKRKEILDLIYDNNSNLSKITDKLMEHFPVLPKNNNEFYSTVMKFISSLAKEDKTYRDLKESVEFLLDNASLLQQADMPTLTKVQIEFMLLSEDCIKTAKTLIDIGCADVLKRAVELKYKGYYDFIHNSKALKNLSPEFLFLLKDKLSKLKYPEQKLEKLQILSALIQSSTKDIIRVNTLIEAIKSPEVTSEQQSLADKIFTSDKPYAEQIEDFIREFNVPIKNQATIRDYLLKAKLNKRLFAPPSIEKQIEIMQIKIKAIENNTKIPADKKTRYLAQLNKQLQDIKEHPEKYNKIRINDIAFKPLAEQIEAYINVPNSQGEFNAKINEMIYEALNITPTAELLESIHFDNKYLARLFAISNSDARQNISKLLNLLMENPNKKLSDIFDQVLENQETHRLFTENGLDYEKWTKFDKDFAHSFTVKVDVEESVKSARNNLIAELKSELAEKLNFAEVEKLYKILEEHHIDKAGQKDLPEIIEAIEKEFESNEYWKSDNAYIQTFKEHIKIHKKNIQSVEKLKNTEEKLAVRLWDNDDIGRNIFFGNHVGCCTSIGAFNDFAAAQHLMNSFVNGIEIVDRGGNSLGNSMCYFAKVDGQLTFVIDSFEANGKLGASKEVTDAIIDYAKQVCERMGRADANIMFGPNFNKVNLDRCIRTDNHTIEVIGRAPEHTYIDCIGGRGDINQPIKDRSMVEVPDL